LETNIVPDTETESHSGEKDDSQGISWETSQ
jgi:hypothetical protein